MVAVGVADRLAKALGYGGDQCPGQLRDRAQEVLPASNQTAFLLRPIEKSVSRHVKVRRYGYPHGRQPKSRETALDNLRGDESGSEDRRSIRVVSREADPAGSAHEQRKGVRGRGSTCRGQP